MKRIPLTQGKFATVDDEDFEWLSQWKWHTKTNKGFADYAIRCEYLGGGRANQKNNHIRMHRLIMKAQSGQHIDHINGNGLDNRKENLRFCTRSQNLQNMRAKVGTSKFKGVCWEKRRRKWHVRITANKRRVHLGYYKDETNAAKAYDDAAKQYHGKFAVLNFN